MRISETGPWRVINEGTRDAAVMSDDFTHDVILKISGDFESDAQRTAYAKMIADRLNGWRPIQESTGPDIPPLF